MLFYVFLYNINNMKTICPNNIYVNTVISIII